MMSEEINYYTIYNEYVREEGLQPKKWMLDALSKNQSSSLWWLLIGHMSNVNDRRDIQTDFENWKEFDPVGIFNFNRVADFSFEIHKKTISSKKCSLGLALWIISERPGRSAIIHIRNIKRNELEDVILFLKQADRYNRRVFSKL